jgi:hypothetical protein
VEGELGLTCRQPVTRLSAVFLDLALELDLPIVPVRFIGGLPILPLQHTIPFPTEFGRQDYVCGEPIFPVALSGRPLPERIAEVIARINAVEPVNSHEHPLPGEASFVAAVKKRVASGASDWAAAMIETIARAHSQFPGLIALNDSVLSDRDSSDPWLAAFAAYLRQG